MSLESSTCYSRVTGKPLKFYFTEEQALDGARRAVDFGDRLTPYDCRNCGYWHLSPMERQTPSTTSYSCTGRDGRPKEAYRSEGDAERRAKIIGREQGIGLRVYLCFSCKGWHLTKG